jgi:hypothetical protein
MCKTIPFDRHKHVYYYIITSEKRNWVAKLVPQLEGVSAASGVLAENLLESLAESASGEEEDEPIRAPISLAINGLRTATKEALKKLAMQRREQMLKEMGMCYALRLVWSRIWERISSQYPLHNIMKTASPSV